MIGRQRKSATQMKNITQSAGRQRKWAQRGDRKKITEGEEQRDGGEGRQMLKEHQQQSISCFITETKQQNSMKERKQEKMREEWRRKERVGLCLCSFWHVCLIEQPPFCSPCYTCAANCSCWDQPELRRQETCCGRDTKRPDWTWTMSSRDGSHRTATRVWMWVLDNVNTYKYQANITQEAKTDMCDDP